MLHAGSHLTVEPLLRPQGGKPLPEESLQLGPRGAHLLVVLASTLALPRRRAAAHPSGRVLVAEFENDVNPVTQEYMHDAIAPGSGKTPPRS